MYAKKKLVLFSQIFLSVLIALGIWAQEINAQSLSVITVPYNQKNPSIPHYAYNGHQTTFKAICRGGSGTIKYQWDFNGDGTYDTAEITVTDKYNLSATYTYPNQSTTIIFAAKIKVWSTTETVYASYPVCVFPDATRDVKVNVACDDGLWWLHNYLTRALQGTVPVANSKNTDRTPARTAAIAWAMQVQGHIADETKTDIDPYVEDVQRCLNYVFYRLNTGTINNQTYGDPENGVPAANDNNLYLKLNDATSNNYDNSIVLATIASSGLPDKTAVIGTYTTGKTYKWIAQEMVDRLAWGQIDSTVGRGGWAYNLANNAGDSGYSSLGLWVYLALEGAIEFGCHVPTFVKTELEYFLKNSGIQKTVNTNNDIGVFKYNTAQADTGRRNKQLTGGGMIAMNLVGWGATADPDHAKWVAAYDCIARNWNTQIYTKWAIDYNIEKAYARYSIMKGARTSSPEIEYFQYGATKYYWYDLYSDYIVNYQTVNTTTNNGSWLQTDTADTDNYLKQDMITVMNVLTMTKALFDPTPEALASAAPLSVIEGCSTGQGEVTFYHSQSFHGNPDRQIVLYEWDYQSDGTYDYSTSDPNFTPRLCHN